MAPQSTPVTNKSPFPLKPTSVHVKNYYAVLAQFHLHGLTTGGNTRSAFADLLKKCASPYHWHLVATNSLNRLAASIPSFEITATGSQTLTSDRAWATI